MPIGISHPKWIVWISPTIHFKKIDTTNSCNSIFNGIIVLDIEIFSDLAIIGLKPINGNSQIIFLKNDLLFKEKTRIISDIIQHLDNYSTKVVVAYNTRYDFTVLKCLYKFSVEDTKKISDFIIKEEKDIYTLSDGSILDSNKVNKNQRTNHIESQLNSLKNKTKWLQWKFLELCDSRDSGFLKANAVLQGFAGWEGDIIEDFDTPFYSRTEKEQKSIITYLKKDLEATEYLFLNKKIANCGFMSWVDCVNIINKESGIPIENLIRNKPIKKLIDLEIIDI